MITLAATAESAPEHAVAKLSSPALMMMALAVRRPVRTPVPSRKQVGRGPARLTPLSPAAQPGSRRAARAAAAAAAPAARGPPFLPVRWMHHNLCIIISEI